LAYLIEMMRRPPSRGVHTTTTIRVPQDPYSYHARLAIVTAIVRVVECLAGEHLNAILEIE
jgi:hypothetical protein